MSTTDRTELIVHKFMKLSDIVSFAWRIWNFEVVPVGRQLGLRLPKYDWFASESSSVGTLGAMHQLSKILRSIRPGDAVFAHLLLPHHPYVVRRDCTYLPWGPWDGIGGPAFSLSNVQNIMSRYAALRARWLSCSRPFRLHRQVRIPSSSSTAIMGLVCQEFGQGDQTKDNFNDEDMTEVFSTLFAIRARGVQPAYFEERRPVAQLLRDFTASGFRTAPHPPQPRTYFVYLTNGDWKPVKAGPPSRQLDKRI